MPKIFDYCVIGAGLAGMHTALELLERGVSVCVIDTRGIAGGASGTPVGLANPATGRFATKTWRGEQSLDKLYMRLVLANEYSTKKYFKQSGILRPALDEKIASRMLKNVDSGGWSAGSVEWMTEKQINEFHPGLNCNIGGVWVPNGVTVHIPHYLNALTNLIEDKGGQVILHDTYEISKSEDWSITFESMDRITASNLIFSSGIWTRHSEFWGHLRLHAVKGQTLIVETNAPISFDHSVSALGYFSNIAENTLFLGSTYEHTFDNEKPDKQGVTYIIERLSKVLPILSGSINIKSSWAGIRASTPDRKPYLGAHPTIENCYVFAGLGSKGLLYSALGAEILADYLMNRVPIPGEINHNRFT